MSVLHMTVSVLLPASIYIYIITHYLQVHAN